LTRLAKIFQGEIVTHPAIRFLDLVTLHVELEEELSGIFKQSLRSAGFIGGPMVEGFEADFANFCDAQHCVGVGSGTDALRFALIAAGVPEGSIVITVPNTFIATSEAISQAGAVPFFVDIDARTYNLDPEKLRDFLQSECVCSSDGLRTVHRATGMPVSAVIPVHLYGQMADMDAIEELAEQYNLLIIEDACQAHGAQYYSQKQQRWRTAGSVGKAAAFSFYPGKNLGACGEGGAITTNDPELARCARMLRDHGQSKKYYHEREGYNGRLDAIQAGILSAKLKHLPDWNARRQAHASRYNDMLRAVTDAIQPPYEPSSSRAAYHLYVVQVEERDAVRQQLGDAGVETGIHYPIPLHLQKAYSKLGYGPGVFPVAEAAADKILSLPMYPSLTCQQQQRVVEVLSAAVQVSPHDLSIVANAR
jgi:dTDP-4-amino-4,6-dideoxygalactose transaminase